MPSDDNELKALRQELKTRLMPSDKDEPKALRQQPKTRRRIGLLDKLVRMKSGHGLALLLVIAAFLCFLLAGVSEGDFSLWIDGAGISLILYGLVRAARWLVSGLQFAEDDPEVPKPPAQKTVPQGTALASNFQARVKRLAGSLTRRHRYSPDRR